MFHRFFLSLCLSVAFSRSMFLFVFYAVVSSKIKPVFTLYSVSPIACKPTPCSCPILPTQNSLFRTTNYKKRAERETFTARTINYTARLSFHSSRTTARSLLEISSYISLKITGTQRFPCPVQNPNNPLTNHPIPFMS